MFQIIGAFIGGALCFIGGVLFMLFVRETSIMSLANEVAGLRVRRKRYKEKITELQTRLNAIYGEKEETYGKKPEAD